ncbi:MAG: LL-diaminopimelate aminotransferase, partial [Gemmatimonadaceae bacterium]|nr:LL-diaminopimelate aminotransferase [Gemmatimonadaceae bacterium]
MPAFTKRLLSLPEYPLAKIPEKKRELIARGVDLIDLGAGDADLAPPSAAMDTLAAAPRTPAMNRYGFGLGLMDYREAIVEWMKKRFGISFNP